MCSEWNRKGFPRWNSPGKKKETGKAKNNPEKNLWWRLKKDGTDMGNGRERSKRETFMEEKEYLHYPEWIDAIKEGEEVFGKSKYMINASNHYSLCS